MRFRFRWLAIAFALCLTAPARGDDLFPSQLLRFEPIAKNPVFTAAGPGHWDARIRERGWILKDEAGWHLWYTGYDGTREGLKMLGYASSPDGLTWTRSDRNPIYKEHWVEDMMVVKTGDTYYMFAEGLNDRAQLLTSTDRLSWTRRGTLRILKTDGSPISEGAYGTPTAWHENGKWRLFYERSDKGIWLAEATSDDLLEWKNVNDEPVISPGPDEFDRKMVAANQVLKIGGRYYLSYHGTAADTMPSKWACGLAVSDDLIHWKKYAGNPLRPIAENKSSGIFVPDGNSFRFYTVHNQVDAYVPMPAK
jgi:predicted GH43/DUF377 family glycosyl hydrolase